MVPRAGADILPRRGGTPGLPHSHRLRAGPPRLRHPAVVAAGHRRQRHRQRAVHGGPQPLGQRRHAELLRFLLHLRSLRPDPRPGTAGRIRGARRGPRPRPAPALAHAFPLPGHPTPGHVRAADRTGKPRRSARRRHQQGHRMSAWRMPSETAPQDRVWMAFPTGGYTLGETAAEAHAARSVWAAVANAVVEFEPVTMLVAPADVQTAAAYLHPDIEVFPAALNDAWMRDIGPTFVLDDDGGRLGAVDWVFNGWGG